MTTLKSKCLCESMEGRYILSAYAVPKIFNNYQYVVPIYWWINVCFHIDSGISSNKYHLIMIMSECNAKAHPYRICTHYLCIFCIRYLSYPCDASECDANERVCTHNFQACYVTRVRTLAWFTDARFSTLSYANARIKGDLGMSSTVPSHFVDTKQN